MARTRSLSAAAAQAPDSAGVYFMLAADTELLYVGKAGRLRRRLRQHAQAQPGTAGQRLDELYRRVAEVRWEELPDERAAEAREADLIVAFQPAFNAGSALAGRWHYLLVEPAGADRLRFRLARNPDVEAGGRVYGCFPHLGRGVGSRPGTACSDGYVALLRLLWTAGDAGDHPPRRITRAAPDTFATVVGEPDRKPLHALFSGSSRRVLEQLAATGERRAAYHLRPGLARDLAAAAEFFRYGPQAIRQLRLRHGRRAGPLRRALIEELLAAEVREAIGEFRLPAPADPVDAFLGRRARPWLRTPDS